MKLFMLILRPGQSIEQGPGLIQEDRMVFENAIVIRDFTLELSSLDIWVNKLPKQLLKGEYTGTYFGIYESTGLTPLTDRYAKELIGRKVNKV